MGYACPVCETPHQDAEHLANHLAFTAMLHDDGHADWLAERVPDWEECGPEDLAERVVDHVDGAEYDAVFEDTVGDEGGDAFGHDHSHGGGRFTDDDLAGYADAGDDLDPETSAVVAEARELTREMLGESADDGGETDDESDDE